MIHSIALISGCICLASGFLACFSWGLVIFLVNPVLDPIFKNDGYFHWFLTESHPFFFAYRAQLYAGAVVSKRLAKRSMKIPEDLEFRNRVDWMGRVGCWGMITCEGVMLVSGVLFTVLEG